VGIRALGVAGKSGVMVAAVAAVVVLSVGAKIFVTKST